MIFKPLATLLHLANQDPPFTLRSEFYDLKRRLLERHAEYVGDAVQHIVKECWGRYTGWNDEWSDCGPTCRKCGGTGIYSESWHVLRKYNWCGYCFHVWHHQQYSAPTFMTVTIEGRIDHPHRGRIHSEAVLWLYLLCGEWRLLWRSLRGSRVCGWTWYPMLNLQKVVMEASMFFHRQRCWCGKWFWTWSSGWHICKACRRRGTEESDVPF